MKDYNMNDLPFIVMKAFNGSCSIVLYNTLVLWTYTRNAKGKEHRRHRRFFNLQDAEIAFYKSVAYQEKMGNNLTVENFYNV